MGYYDSDEDVQAYVKMAEGFDGAELVERLVARLDAGAKVLELGMGAGKDLDLMAQAGLEPTGSDASDAFLRRYREQGGRFEALKLDAVTLETELTFDAVYSNKVLHHLTREQLRRSLARQAQVAPGGWLLHSFWYGEHAETFKGMLSTHYTEALLAEATPSGLEMVESGRYAEFEAGDSLWALWRVTPVANP